MATAGTTGCGWYRDPYRRHEDRYFSDGTPTKLVRDGASESFDPPPDEPLSGPPVPAARPIGRARGSGPGPSDLRRADDAERESAYDRRTACEIATSSMVRWGAAR
jgi:hypothetical protein